MIVVKKGNCIECGSPRPSRNRRYCQLHSKVASALWKRKQRRELKLQQVRYWLDQYRADTDSEAAARAAYNAYHRDRRRRLRESKAPTAITTQPGSATANANSVVMPFCGDALPT